MPLKHHSARRHRITRAQYRVRNWAQYDAGLRCRGDLTLWLDEAALAGWQAARRTTPEGQARYSEPYVRPAARLMPLAIMGARSRVRHQSESRSRRSVVCGVAWTVLQELVKRHPWIRFAVREIRMLRVEETNDLMPALGRQSGLFNNASGM